jgi:hypothetical protein
MAVRFCRAKVFPVLALPLLLVDAERLQSSRWAVLAHLGHSQCEVLADSIGPLQGGRRFVPSWDSRPARRLALLAASMAGKAGSASPGAV